MRSRNGLPTFKDSPAFKYFRHWLADDGLVDAADVRTYWNMDFNQSGKMVVRDVAISYFPVTKMVDLGYFSHPLFDEQRCIFRGPNGYPYHGGNKFAEWMENGDVKSSPPYPEDTGCNIGYGPTEEYEGLKIIGFENEVYARQALEQFSFIRECEWARRELSHDR